jgi:hypothetical protein
MDIRKDWYATRKREEDKAANTAENALKKVSLPSLGLHGRIIADLVCSLTQLSIWWL